MIPLVVIQNSDLFIILLHIQHLLISPSEAAKDLIR